jgi:hypothetical protein
MGEISNVIAKAVHEAIFEITTIRQLADRSNLSIRSYFTQRANFKHLNSNFCNNYATHF